MKKRVVSYIISAMWVIIMAITMYNAFFETEHDILFKIWAAMISIFFPLISCIEYHMIIYLIDEDLAEIEEDEKFLEEMKKERNK